MSELACTPTQAVAVIGGAVAGAEIASKMAENGILVAVFERNRHPFGKVDDGIPRWHSELRRKERARILDRLSGPGIEYVPCTTVGEDVSFRDLAGPKWNFTAVVLANGASRDRVLELASGQAASEFVGRGFEYRRPFVRSFNHTEDEAFEGRRIAIPRGGGVVIGGGLAAFDAAKILNLQAICEALGERDIRVDLEQLEADGIEDTLDQHGLTWDELGVEPARVYYRGRIADMSVLAVPAGADHLRRAKVEATRTRLVAKVRAKYGVEVVPLATPDSLLVEGERVVGIRMRRTVLASGQLVRTDETFDVTASIVVAAIGSVPDELAGVPMRGEFYRLDSKEPFVLDGFPNVFAVGNVLSGKGDFEATRDSARRVSEAQIESYLGIIDFERAAREAKEPRSVFDTEPAPVEEVVRRTNICTHHSPGAMLKLREQIAARQREVGYDGDLRAWV